MASFDGKCSIRRAIIDEDGTVRLDLNAENNAFGGHGWRWCYTDKTIATEALTIGLTAIATASRVVVYVDDIPADTTKWLKMSNVGLAGAG